MAQYDADPVRGGEYTVGGTRDAGTPDDPAAIRAEIRDTRERVGDTLEQIAERLNPRHVKEQVKEQVRENIRGAADHVRDNIRETIRGSTIGRVGTMAQNAAGRAGDTGSSFVETLRSNPIPAAMIGLGLGWLFVNGRRQRNERDRYETYDSTLTGTRPAYGAAGYADADYGSSYGAASGGAYYGGARADAPDQEGALDRVRDRAGELRDSAGNLVHRAQDSASQLADRVGSRAQNAASSVAQRTRYQAGRVEDQFYETPLAVGAATLALGLAVGLAAPSTRRESELMGDARDRLVDRAKDLAGDVKDKAQHVAERVVSEAKPAVTQVAGQVASQLTQTAKDAARDEGLSREGLRQELSSSGSQGLGGGQGLAGSQGLSGSQGLGGTQSLSNQGLGRAD